MTPAAQETNRNKSDRYTRLKRVGRTLGGYALGFGGVAFIGGGVMGGPGAAVAGGAIGSGMLYASRKVMRPLYEPVENKPDQSNTEPVQEQQPESRLRRFGRGLMFAGGMALNYLGAVFVGSALFADAPINTASERIVAGGFGVASWVGGDHLISKSYDPNLYQAYDQAQEIGSQQPATA